MSKLKYPESGINFFCKSEISSCTTLLQNASLLTDFSVPSSFEYKAYLSELKVVLNKYSKEINDISSKIDGVSKIYEDLEKDLTVKSTAISAYKVKKRDRLIRK